MMYAQEIAEHLHQGLNDAPTVYVGTYGKYNNGSIMGAWLDLSTFFDYEEFLNTCKLLHADEADPEFMFQDYENFPREWYYEGGMGEEIFDKIKDYSELNDAEKELFELYMDEFDKDIDPSWFKNRISSVFYGSYEDFAREIYCGESVPEWLDNYIKWDDLGEDLLQGEKYVWTEEGKLAVFQNC